MSEAMQDVLDQASCLLASFELGDENLKLAIIFGVGLILGLAGIVFGTFCSVSRERQRQQTKREIAAYVAEGSMSPDDARSIIESNERPSKA